ncbi:Uma2 family endonuclease [Calothrix sp. 336/3]|uniref:Uma2 family endonuclease n=1 Tax=Calothrix sp. 336/3 TaxID=1337936 RepID=UPI0004E4061C|nr:Uma2 family endonuclease [Calothrix sp. 336/3]AKG20311.1 hypothetical protein IJ00_02360 [Calothrix sp. 336/3]
MTSITINFQSITEISDEQFYQLCRQNPDIKFERNTRGELIIMPLTGGETGKITAKIITKFVLWNEETELGEVFDSSTCFKLPNGANRSPDVSWIEKSRWEGLSQEEREKFPPIAPDFILELMSPSDSLPEIQKKMQEYMDGGVKLGWLIDRKNRCVEIYRQGKTVEILTAPTTISGEDILPGLILGMLFIWN